MKSCVLREIEVEEAIRDYLREHGFDVRQRKKKQGVDIVAAKSGKTYYVEVEGNKKPSGDPLITSQKYTHLLRAIGQICLRMNDDPNGAFAIGLPEDQYYREKTANLLIALKKLKVKLLFVEANGEIVEQ